MNSVYTDILVAGAGLAGIKAAYSASLCGLKVAVISKSSVAASNFILGFNAAVSENDSTALFCEDTIKGGKYIGKQELAFTLAKNSADEVKNIERLGLKFDKNEKGYNLLRPLGCSTERLVHIENHTGKTTLERYKDEAVKNGVKIIDNAMLCDLITKDNKVIGVSVFDLQNEIKFYICAKAVVLACGGIHIESESTYAPCMTGDGYGAALRAGAYLTDMEFIQFEPCRCIFPQKLGISTTLLSHGGKITNKNGERFLLKEYSSEGEIPKDSLAKLIYAEIKKGNGTPHGGVYLDLTDIPEKEIKKDHILYYKRFLGVGIDITKEKIEVAPCAHSFMGGVVVDEKCRTSVNGLFAAGEVTGGLHGANRVGGNAGTEVYVFGTIAGKSAAEYAKNCSVPHSSFSEEQTSVYGNVQKDFFENIKKTIYENMSNYMGPLRTEKELVLLKTKLKEISEQIRDCSPADFKAEVSKKECENMLIVCTCCVKAAIKRKESRGVHSRKDYPNTDDKYLLSFIFSKDDI